MNLVLEKILVLRAKEKDRAAAEKLIMVHYKTVYEFLFRLCQDSHLAQDLTQETFIKVWKNIDRFQGQSRFSTWLYRISYNLYLDYRKKKKVTTTSLDKETIRISHFSTFQPDIQYEKTDYLYHIMAHIDKLPEKFKEILLLHYQQELSLKEISHILSIPKGTVKSRLHTALNHVRKKLKQSEKNNIKDFKGLKVEI